MSIVKPTNDNNNQAQKGFSWSVQVSEKTLITWFIISSSFGSGFAFSQVQAASQTREMGWQIKEITVCPSPIPRP